MFVVDRLVICSSDIPDSLVGKCCYVNVQNFKVLSQHKHWPMWLSRQDAYTLA